VLRLAPVPLEIEDQRHKRFGDETAAENAEHALLVGAGAKRIGLNGLVHEISSLSFASLRASYARTAAAKARIFSGSLTPGARSIPDETSSLAAQEISSASPTFSVVNPPEST